MTITHPWWLLVIPALILWLGFGLRARAGRASLLLKGLSLCAIALALSEPRLMVPQTKTAVSVLVDTSGSIDRDQLSQESKVVDEVGQKRGNNWMQVIPFADGTRKLRATETGSAYHLEPSAGESASATDFEGALRDSLSNVPENYNSRLVLISDGRENKGNSARAIAEFQRLHIPVDTFSLPESSKSQLRFQSVAIPQAGYAGELIPLDLHVTSPSATQAQIDLSAEGKSLGTTPVTLEPGSNLVRVHARVNAVGVTSIAGQVRDRTGGELRFQGAVSLKRARVLYVSQDPVGTDENLLRSLRSAQLEVVTNPADLNKDLSTYQLVVLNNLDLTALPQRYKENLEHYVKEGGGLLLIGGERQIYKEDAKLDALDRALPAKLAPPKSPEGTCVALIIDKSSSMEGRKIDLARISAIGVVDHLRPIDYIGVLIFDNSFQWAVPVRHAEDKSLIKRLVAGITPDGGTQIAPALAEAYRRVLPSKATFKHIVLLTDGISEEGDSLDLAKEALAHQVTISTVGLGQDVNRTYLEKVALTSGGKSYFLNEPQGLEQILLKDVQDYSGSTAVERPLTPILDHPAEILEGVNIESAPPLKGYTRFIAKPTSDTLLSIDESKKDPLYVRWQYGLGKAAVFTSDAKSRWAESWVGWPGFDKFWINVTRDLLDHSQTTEASAQFDSASDEVKVTYHLGPGSEVPRELPTIFVLGPQAFRKPITLENAGSRIYTGKVRVGSLHGLFRIRPLAETKVFPELGLYRGDAELEHGSDPRSLQQIARLTGGRFNPTPASVYDGNGRITYNSLELWPAALAAAIALTLAELIVRKWSGLKSLTYRT